MFGKEIEIPEEWTIIPLKKLSEIDSGEINGGAEITSKTMANIENWGDVLWAYHVMDYIDWTIKHDNTKKKISKEGLTN